MTVHLSILIFWPAALAIVGALLPRTPAKLAAVAGALVPLGYGVLLVADFETGATGLQYVTDDAWIEDLGIRYKLGVDGLNLFMVLLTALLFAASALWVALRDVARPKLYSFHMGLAQTAVLGAFLAQDLALFVLFFDLMLVPFYFLTGQWGGRDRVAATAKLVIYTLVGSLLMLAAAVATAVLAGEQSDTGISFVLSDLILRPLSEGEQRWIFVAFALAFLIKMPAFPFHGWMPDGYRAMPLPVLAVFSAVLSKVAAYGFLRVVLPVFPEASADFQTLMLVLALLSIVYGSCMAFTQTDARLVLGYSSVAQLGFITLGIFALQEAGAQGALIQMVNHGLVVAPLFFIVALLAERAGGSEDIRELGGIAFNGPVLAAFFLIAGLANLALPGSANFVGEFLILLGVFQAETAIAIIATLGIVLASVYTLRLFIRAVHNRTGPRVRSHDISVRDGLVVAPLVGLIIAFGVYPQIALERADIATQQAIGPVRAIVAPVPAGESAPGVPAAPGGSGTPVPVEPGGEAPVPVEPGGGGGAAPPPEAAPEETP